MALTDSEGTALSEVIRALRFLLNTEVRLPHSTGITQLPCSIVPVSLNYHAEKNGFLLAQIRQFVGIGPRGTRP